MAFDLTDIYDKGLSEEDLTKKQNEVLGDTPSYMGGNVSMYKPREYTGYLTEGLFEEKGDPDIQRGEAQSAVDKWGNMMPQTVGKIGTQLLDMIGGIQELIFGWGDNRDYTNAWTEAADAGNSFLDKNFPMYRTSKDLVSFSDAAWWTQNISGLTASVAGFALGGSAIAKGLGLGTLGRLGKLGSKIEQGIAFLGANPATAARVAQLGEKTLAAGMLAYAEGAMSGRRVFEETYAAQLAAGKTEEEAQHIAAQSAATTIQLNTILNTGLNMAGGMGMFFNHGSDEVMRAAKKVLKQEVGETTENYLKRLKDTEATTYRWAMSQPFEGKSTRFGRLTEAAREASAEGVEELSNQFAEAVGIQEGKKGQVHAFAEQLSLLSEYFDHTMNAEGALNFVLGAIAGPVQNTIASYIPLHKVVKGAKTVNGKLVDAKGNFVENPEDADVEYYNEGRRMSAVKRSKVFEETYFNNIKDKIVDDVSHILEVQSKLKEAVAKGDILEAEELRRSLFEVQNTNSVMFGMGDNLKATYEELSQVDNTVEDEKGLTEAMRLGLARDKNDNAYQKKAQDALKDITQLKKLHDTVYKKYGVDKDFGRMEDVHLADFIFQTSADLYHAKQTLKRAQEELSEEDKGVMEEAFNQVADSIALTERARRDYMRKYKRHLNRVEKFKSTQEIINKAITNLRLGTLEGTIAAENALNELGLFAMEGESGINFLERSLKALNKVQEKRLSDAEEFQSTVLEDESYQTWKAKEGNEEKTLQDYYAVMGKTLQENAYVKRLNNRISHLEEKVAVLEEATTALTSAKTLSKLKKNTENYFKDLKKAQDRVKSQATQRIQETAVKDDTIRGYNQKIIQRLISRYTTQLEKNANKLGVLTKELESLKETLQKVEKYYVGDASTKLEAKIASKIAEGEALVKESNLIDSYLNELNEALVSGITVPTPPTPAPSEESSVPKPPNTAAALQNYKDVGTSKGLTPTQLMEAAQVAQDGTLELKHFMKYGLSAEDSALVAQSLKELKAAYAEVLELIDSFQTKAEEFTNIAPTESSTAEEEDIFDYVEDSALEVNLTSAPIPTPKSSGGVLGMKQEFPSTSGAHRSTIFFERRNSAGKIERESTRVADDTTIFTVLDPRKLTPGTVVSIEIDENYKGDINIPDTDVAGRSKAPTQGYLDVQELLSKGFPAEDTPEFEEWVQKIPLKIVLDGKTVQWVHLPSWILSKDPKSSGDNAEDYRNVIDSKTDPITGEYIIEPGNAIREAAHCAAIRRSILRLLKRGETVQVEVSSKGEGIVLKAPNDYNASNLKETRIEGGQRITTTVPIGISTENGIKGLENTPQFVGQLNPEYEPPVGRLVALIPMADNSRIPVPLGGKRLADLPNVVHTFHRAIELFLGPYNASELEQVFDSTGFNLSTRDGLRNYISQYFTYFTAPGALKKGVNLVFANKTLSVVTVTDAGTLETVLEVDPTTKRLTRESTSALSKVLENRYRAVAFSNRDRNLKGLNSTESFKEVLYTPEGGWKEKSYPSYNEFLLKDLTSPVTYLNPSDRGVEYTEAQGAEYPGKYYFYGVNPIVEYNFTSVLDRARTGVVGEVAPIQTAPEANQETVAENLFDLTLWDKALPQTSTEEIESVGTQESEIIGLESLTKLYNFTPQSDRNGLTPLEVLVRLRQLKVSHIPPGYNPFKRCT